MSDATCLSCVFSEEYISGIREQRDALPVPDCTLPGLTRARDDAVDRQHSGLAEDAADFEGALGGIQMGLTADIFLHVPFVFEQVECELPSSDRGYNPHAEGVRGVLFTSPFIRDVEDGLDAGPQEFCFTTDEVNTVLDFLLKHAKALGAQASDVVTYNLLNMNLAKISAGAMAKLHGDMAATMRAYMGPDLDQPDDLGY